MLTEGGSEAIAETVLQAANSGSKRGGGWCREEIGRGQMKTFSRISFLKTRIREESMRSGGEPSKCFKRADHLLKLAARSDWEEKYHGA